MTETPQQPPPPGWNAEHLTDYRELRRSRLDRKVAGVAGGLGRHLDVDPTILRVLFVVLALFGGAGVLLYVALWLVVPEEGSEHAVIGTSDRTRNALLIAAVVVAGLVAIGNGLHGSGYPWLLVAGLVVAAVLVTRDRGRSPAGSAGPPAWQSAGSAAGSAPAAPWYPPVAPAPARTGPVLFGPTLALIALAVGALGLYDATGGSVADAAYPAVALAVTGLMLVAGAFVGRAGGLILVGLLAALLLVVTALGRPSFRGDRDLVVRPSSAAQLRDSYEVPAGRVELDLSRIGSPGSLEGRTVDVSANAGEIVVVVPRQVPVLYTADVQYGGLIEAPGTTRDGWAPSLTSTLGPSTGARPLRLDLRLAFGHIQVVRAGAFPVPGPAPAAPVPTPRSSS